MNKKQKEVLQSQLNSEEAVLGDLKKIYKKALDDINSNIATLKGRTDVENVQSIVYQLDYQNALKTQVSGILDTMNAQQFTSISDYLTKCYDDGFLGTMYDLHGQGIPMIFPIDQKQVVSAVQLDSKLSSPLYTKLGEDVNLLKQHVSNNISRGLAQGSSYEDISKNIASKMTGDYSKMKGGALYRAMTITRTEGHRITGQANTDAQKRAKDNGAEVMKQWDATLDGRTRPHHAQLDGQLRELDEDFEVNGYKASYPGGFGIAKEDINCRCASLMRAKWALDEEELDTLKERAEYFNLDKTESFEDFKKKYMKAVEDAEPVITYPFEGKKYHMNPDGSFSEGVDGVQNSYSLADIPSNEILIVDNNTSLDDIMKYDVTINGNNIEIAGDKAKLLKAGEKFDEITYTLNADGTYSKGAQKLQAQYKMNLKNNKVFTIDVTDEIKNINPDVDDIVAVKYNVLFNSMPQSHLKSAIYDKYMTSDDTLADAFKSVLHDESYKAINVINTNSATKDIMDDFVEMLDDSIVTKTKKSKLETLSASLKTAQNKLNKVDNKTYTGIWKNDVKVSDYPSKKDSIQAKKDWYLTEISKLDASDAKAIQYQKYINDIDEFEKLGIQYETAYNKVNKIKADIKKYTPTTSGTRVSGEAFSQERKDNAHWFTSDNGGTKGADKVLRDKTGEVWRNATNAERRGAYGYTAGSGAWNRPLSGFEKPYFKGGKGWEPEFYKNPKNVWIDFEGHGDDIRAMTDLIDKCDYENDMWLQRGCGNSAIESFLNIPFGSMSGMSEAELQQYVGTNNRIYGFLSSSVSKGNGFSGEVIMNIYAPSGSKMIYAEPFSAFGAGDKSSWDGISKQSSFGGESEMILQRGGSYTVTKIEKSKSGYTTYIDVEVHPEDGYDYFQQDPNEWTGSKINYQGKEVDPFEVSF